MTTKTQLTGECWRPKLRSDKPFDKFLHETCRLTRSQVDLFSFLLAEPQQAPDKYRAERYERVAT